MSNLSLVKQLWMASISMIIVTVFLGGFGYITALKLHNQIDLIGNTNMPAAATMTDIDMMHDNISSNVYAGGFYRLTNNQAGVDKANNDNMESIERIQKNMEKLSNMNISAESKSLIADSKNDLDFYLNLSKTLLSAYSKNQVQEAQAKMDDFSKSFDVLEVKLEALGKQIEKETSLESGDSKQSLLILAFGTVFIAIGSFIVSILILRQIGPNSQLNKYMSFLANVAKSVLEISQKLSASNVQLSANATETASSLEETVASMEELSSMINLNTDNSQKSYRISLQAKETAQEGERGIEKLNRSINEIKSESRKMEEIVNVIDDISFQTNLLALNAAVEAARAGEQGKGFAVVADAVRSLAQRSSTSAKEINMLIKESVTKVENSSELAEICSQSLRSIVEQVNQVTDLSNQIASASQEQTAGLKQINQAMLQLDSSTQDNASAAESLSSAATDADIESGKMATAVSDVVKFIFGIDKTSQLNLSTEFNKNVYSFSNKNKNSQAGSSKKMKLDLGAEPVDNKIKKIENF